MQEPNQHENQIKAQQKQETEQIQQSDHGRQEHQQSQDNIEFRNYSHQQIVQGINDFNQISNFNCEWIDIEQSPLRVLNQSFPSEIQIGLDGINVWSNHHLQQNHTGFNLENDISINNDQCDISINTINNEQGFTKRIKQFEISNSRIENHNVLDDSQTHDERIFEEQGKIISQIKSPKNYKDETQNQESQQNSINAQFQKNHNNTQAEKNILNDQNHIDSTSQQNSAQRRGQKISEQLIHKQQSLSKSSTEKGRTLIINENSFGSKISDDFSLVQQSKLLKSMCHYIETNNSTYKPFYSLLEKIFINTKSQSDRSMENFNMYADFFKQKNKQLQKYLREAQSQKTERLFQNLKKKEINNLVYVDSNVVLRDIHQRNIKKVKIHRMFQKQIQEVSIDFKKIISEVYQKRKKSANQITAILFTVKSLQNDLLRLIEYRLNYERRKSDPQFNINAKEIFKVENPHAIKDHYLQIKIIVQKQALYISKLKQLRMEVVKYLTIVFLNDQIVLSSKIKENLINYTEMLIELQKLQRKIKQNQKQTKQSLDSDLQILQNKKEALSQKKIHEQLRVELSRRIFQCTPQSLRVQLGIDQFKDKMTPQQLLELLNGHFQNQVFFSCIELEDEFIFYKCEGSWLSRDQYRALEESQKASHLQKNLNKQNQTHNSLRLILTVNKYLHMQQNQKIATLKLNEIKISKKGNFIIISDRGKGIVGFLVNNGNQLGRIRLNSAEEADIFAQKLKQLVEEK